MRNNTRILIGAFIALVVIFLVAFIVFFTVLLPRQRLQVTQDRLRALAAAVDAVVAAYAAETQDQPPYDINAVRTRYARYLVEHRIPTSDGWRQEIKITLRQTGGYQFVSGGPDLTMFTGDDVVLEKD